MPRPDRNLKKPKEEKGFGRRRVGFRVIQVTVVGCYELYREEMDTGFKINGIRI